MPLKNIGERPFPRSPMEDLMRISDAYLRLDVPTVADAKAPKRETPDADHSSATNVKLSKRAQELADQVDNGKVADLKAGLQNGSFTIDPAKIAAKLLGDDID